MCTEFTLAPLTSQTPLRLPPPPLSPLRRPGGGQDVPVRRRLPEQLHPDHGDHEPAPRRSHRGPGGQHGRHGSAHRLLLLLPGLLLRVPGRHLPAGQLRLLTGQGLTRGAPSRAGALAAHLPPASELASHPLGCRRGQPGGEGAAAAAPRDFCAGNKKVLSINPQGGRVLVLGLPGGTWGIRDWGVLGPG